MDTKTPGSQLSSNNLLSIGLMSGTSADGIDGVLADFGHDSNGQLSVNVVDHISVEFDPVLRTDILTLQNPGFGEIDLAGSVHKRLAQAYASAVNQLLKQNNHPKVAVIGSHGQTIRHRPDIEPPFTWQLGCGATLTQLTGIATVSDFRSADMACGGQGAPFAPFLHNALFRSSSENRCVVNIGGISNVTFIPADSFENVIGFDTGPGNGLMDIWYANNNDGQFDDNGDWAATGQVQHDLLKIFLSDNYFSRTPPKSTGREYFDFAWLKRALDEFNKTSLAKPKAADIQATLTALTAQTIGDQINQAQPDVESVYCCGGGVFNTRLMKFLDDALDSKLHTTDEIGLDPKLVEPVAFAWLALQTLDKKHSTIPSVTGASRTTITGAIHYP